MVNSKGFNLSKDIALMGLCVSIAFSIVAVEFFVGLLFILWLVKILRADKSCIVRSSFSLVLFVLMATRAVSVFSSIDRPDSIIALGKLPLILVFFPINSLFDRKTLERALMVFVVSIAVAAALGSTRVIFFELDRARTTYGGYTGLSLQILIALVFGLYFMLKKNRGITLWPIPAMILLTVGLFACLARSQWISALLGCSFFFAVAKPKRIPYFALILVAGLLLLPESIILRAFDTFHFGGDSSRLALWRGSLDLLNEVPLFGFGPRTFHEIFPAEAMNELIDKSVWNYHNDFLQIALESGWLAFTAILALWISIFVLLYHASRNGDWLKTACGAALLGLFFSSMFNGVLLDPMIMPAFALLLVILGRREDISPLPGDRIILVRLDKIGDVVLTTPMAGALKQKFPGVEVDIAVRPIAAPIAALSGHINKVVTAPDSIFSLSRKIRDGKYKIAVLVHSELKGALAIALAGVPNRIGTGFRLWSPLLLTHRILRHKDGRRHESSLNADLLAFIGIDPSDLPPPNLIVPLKQKKGLIGFHPGSGGSALRFPASVLGETARKLRSAGFQIMLTGGPDDLSAVEEFLCACGTVDIDLFGKTDLKNLAEKIAECEVFVAQGTGPLHIACGIGVSVVGIFPPSLRTGAKRWRPLGGIAKIIAPVLPECKRCIGLRCRHHNCMESIRPEVIITAVKELSVAKSEIDSTGQ